MYKKYREVYFSGRGKLKHHTSQLHEDRETTTSHFSPFSSAATDAAAAAISVVIAVVSVSMSSSFDVYSSNGFDDDDHRHHPFDDASFVEYDTANGFASDDAVIVEKEDAAIEYNGGFSGSEEFVNGNGKGKGFGDVRFGSDDGAGLGELDEVVGVEEGFASREWRRLNVIRLEEKEMLEKELRNQILEEAEEFNHAFYEKRMLNIETSKTNNRDKEKVYVACQEKFHKEADKRYWKAISDLIPHEVPNIEKRRGKEQEKAPSITVVQGPKPGKPTDLSRLRHIHRKLKHSPPPHMIPLPSKEEKQVAEGKDVGSSSKVPAQNPEEEMSAASVPQPTSGAAVIIANA
ncbi:hypothetical protein Droror1_Dr00010430 [Drosera rotundifolia]